MDGLDALVFIPERRGVDAGVSLLIGCKRRIVPEFRLGLQFEDRYDPEVRSELGSQYLEVQVDNHARRHIQFGWRNYNGYAAWVVAGLRGEPVVPVVEELSEVLGGLTIEKSRAWRLRFDAKELDGAVDYLEGECLEPGYEEVVLTEGGVDILKSHLVPTQLYEVSFSGPYERRAISVGLIEAGGKMWSAEQRAATAVHVAKGLQQRLGVSKVEVDLYLGGLDYPEINRLVAMAIYAPDPKKAPLVDKAWYVVATDQHLNSEAYEYYQVYMRERWEFIDDLGMVTDHAGLKRRISRVLGIDAQNFDVFPEYTTVDFSNAFEGIKLPYTLEVLFDDVQEELCLSFFEYCR
ncbi:hypothetical protein [Pseudovibrio sp. Tun.PSC04-5.I4]|uniref:DUF4875 domain-containing protein n=1 Tax=Pseudovibrio sp. Tun.PSC04-5.I4 TaxID=1798213 RepID=UPI0013564F6A|nr:hypothetical protein [Pseudovibrio sp. Tun.PSC04-5.I4]